MASIVNQIIRTYWLVNSTAPARVAGLDETDFNIDLSADGIAAPEAVTVTDVGDGVYEFSWTPLTAATYALAVTELTTFPLSAEASFIREFQVLSAGSVFAPAFDHAFCSEDDVERYAGETYDSGSNPSADAVAGFAEETAAYLIAKMQACAGVLITPAGMGAPLDNSSIQGQVLEDMLRNANAVGAAAKAKRAAFLGQPPNESPVPEILEGIFLGLAGGYDPVKRVMVEGAICMFLKSSTTIDGVPANLFAKTHISSGERSQAAPLIPGLAEVRNFTDRTKW